MMSLTRTRVLNTLKCPDLIVFLVCLFVYLLLLLFVGNTTRVPVRPSPPAPPTGKCSLIYKERNHITTKENQKKS